uniref:Microfibril associated protein 5 n=1 Tax=Seriola dumerili TaxID=41447 RepID=A0A3B4U5D3_SERDU
MCLLSGMIALTVLRCFRSPLTPASFTPLLSFFSVFISAPLGSTFPSYCREEMYPCTRMYSVHKPIKRCIGGLCFYSVPRVYVINKEICMRTVCQQDEYLKAELCRELSGWPRRFERSSNRKPCRSRRSNPKTWANKA